MSNLLKEFCNIRRYKSNQGRLVRQLTMLGIWAICLCAAYKFFQMPFEDVKSIPVLGLLSMKMVRGVVALVLALVGIWIGFRLVNMSSFADFLIAVESEMVKVSWPSKAELYSSTIVVLVMFLLLSGMIFVFDLIWIKIFTVIHVL